MSLTLNVAETAGDDSLMDDFRCMNSDPNFLQTVHNFMSTGEDQWVTPELRDVVFFAWGVLLKECGPKVVFEGEWGSSGTRAIE